MMFSMPYEQHVASREVVKALNLILMLHADHEQNCSTSTVRIVGSSQANLFASCAAGVCSLWGPLHGGANVAVLEMLEQIHHGGLSADQAIAQAKDRSSGFRLMGFGHRVYKNFDPRAVILKQAADRGAGPARRSTTPCSTSPASSRSGPSRTPTSSTASSTRTSTSTAASSCGRSASRRTCSPSSSPSAGCPAGSPTGRSSTTTASGRIARPRQVYMGPNETDYVPIDAQVRHARPGGPRMPLERSAS